MIKTVSIALASAKAATAIIKDVNELDIDADVKVKVGGLIATVIDLQNAMLELQSRLVDSERETNSLKEQLHKIQEANTKNQIIVFRNKLYWKDGDETPFCPKCWETGRMQVHLSGPFKRYNKIRYYCEVCEVFFPLPPGTSV